MSNGQPVQIKLKRVPFFYFLSYQIPIQFRLCQFQILVISAQFLVITDQILTKVTVTTFYLNLLDFNLRSNNEYLGG